MEKSFHMAPEAFRHRGHALVDWIAAYHLKAGGPSGPNLWEEHMTRRILIAAIGLSILAGCAGFGKILETPKIQLAHITVKEARVFETVFQLELRIFNVNEIPLVIKGIDCEMQINGEKFAIGVSAVQSEIPAMGTGLVPVEVYASTLGMAKSFIEMAQRAGKAGAPVKMEYGLDGRLKLGGNAMMPFLPFKSKGQVSLEGLTPST